MRPPPLNSSASRDHSLVCPLINTAASARCTASRERAGTVLTVFCVRATQANDREDGDDQDLMLSSSFVLLLVIVPLRAITLWSALSLTPRLQPGVQHPGNARELF